MKDLKSITSLRPCMLISILVFLMTIFFFMNSVVADDAHRKIVQDLPGKADFDRYLRALEMVVDFSIRHKYYVDFNFEFGLFLLDVNLRQVLQQKRPGIPTVTRSRLEKLLVKNDIVTNYFHLMVQKSENVSALKQNLKLTLLIYNATTWSTPLDTFNLDLLTRTTIYSPEQLKKIYGRWKNYYSSVTKYESNSPTPVESDKCLSYLEQSSSLRLNRSQPNCLTPPRCKKILQKGGKYGYWLTHRLLYLVLARFSRRCVVFSEEKDKFMADMFCKKCFSEAEYIASNNFELADLFYEQIALCGIFGHAQFLRNYWLKTLLRYQIFEGCFRPQIVTGNFDEGQSRDVADQTWHIEAQASIMNGECYGHFSGMAAAIFSQALRYIIETHY